MQRALSIFLILFFGFGPLSAASQESDESRLPRIVLSIQTDAAYLTLQCMR